MQFLIHFDAFTELPSAPPRSISPRQIPWRWIIVSIFAHALMLLFLLQFNYQPNGQDKVDIQLRPVIAAQLLMPELPIKAEPEAAPETAPEPVPEKIAPKTIPNTIPKQIAEKPEPSTPVLAPETLPSVKSSPAIPESQTFSFNQAKPDILAPTRSRLLSTTTTRAEIQAFFNSYNSGETQVDALQEAGSFATAQISPELFAGVPELSPAEQDAKQIYEAKIDVDCSSDINKVLATISQFTLHAVVCQSNGDIDKFIQQRLAGKDSKARMQGLKPRQQRKQSN